ncbi:MAG: hypothetical protein FWE36_00240 [Erysipelotrichales bacterium]|nr:hypothetical protein [Erysipelotrichales bacterium]
MSNIKDVSEIYEKLRVELGIEKFEASKRCLVDELAKQASFLLCEIDVLQEQIKIHGSIQINKNGRQKQTEASKLYSKGLTTLVSVMKSINTIIGKVSDDGGDELEMFLNKMKG